LRIAFDLARGSLGRTLLAFRSTEVRSTSSTTTLTSWASRSARSAVYCESACRSSGPVRPFLADGAAQAVRPSARCSRASTPRHGRGVRGRTIERLLATSAHIRTKPQPRPRSRFDIVTSPAFCIVLTAPPVAITSLSLILANPRRPTVSAPSCFSYFPIPSLTPTLPSRIRPTYLHLFLCLAFSTSCPGPPKLSTR